MAGIEVGCSMVLGGVEWDVVYQESGRFLLLASDVLRDDAGIRRIRFHNRISDATWETCSLRGWLNSDFLAFFSPEELAHVCSTRVVNFDSSRYGTPGGNDTVDKVFCLSVETVRSLLTEEQMAASHCWYLRSPGFQGSYAANVRENGGVFEFGRHVFLEFYGIRPALWYCEDTAVAAADDLPFTSLFGFATVPFPAKLRMAMAFLASYSPQDPRDQREVLDFLRRNMGAFADAAFAQSGAEGIVRGAMRAGLVDASNADDFLERARKAENWSLVAALLEFRAHGMAPACGMTEEELLELQVFGGLD